VPVTPDAPDAPAHACRLNKSVLEPDYALRQQLINQTSYGYWPIPDFPIQVHKSEVMLLTEIWLDIPACFPQDGLEPMSCICRHLGWIVLPLCFRSQKMFQFLETFAFRRLSIQLLLFAEHKARIKISSKTPVFTVAPLARSNLLGISGDLYQSICTDILQCSDC
jgi:hypothetical protein